MKIAYFDCFSGISGDMAVGALLDAGVPLRVVVEGLAKIGLTDARVHLGTRSITRSQIHATKFDVLTPGGHSLDAIAAENGNGSGAEGHEHAGAHHHAHAHGAHHHAPGQHHHDHDHPHDHDDHHDHAHDHDHDHAHSSYRAIIEMIDRSELPEGVKNRARGIFRVIAIAEARIHNTSVDDVHFHEVGAIDSIADVIAVAVCLDHLGIEEVYSSTVPLGTGGMIRTQHGVMPLPAPATLEILKGYPVMLTSIPFELTTPTGAGILKALSKGTLATERMQVERIGFGAGTRELPDRPNLLRVVVGELLGDEEQDMVTLIETNIDDMNPQVYPYLLERLLEAGAFDAYLSPVIMKKGRPGMLLTVIAPAGAIDELTKVIYRETTTIGVRFREMMRRKLPREEIVVPSEFGLIRMKRIMTLDGVRIAPEYDEARRIARERAIPLHSVLMTLDEVARRVVAEMPDAGR
jgi:uncharacterized protein (TIGR00299 family) protein